MGSDESRLIKNSVLTPLVSGFPLPRFQIDCSQTRVTWPVTNRRTSLHRSHCIHDIHWIWLRWRLTEPVVGGHHCFHWVIFFSGAGQSRSSESVTDSVTRVSRTPPASVSVTQSLATQSCPYKCKIFRSRWDLRWDLRRIGFGRRSSTPKDIE